MTLGPSLSAGSELKSIGEEILKDKKTPEEWISAYLSLDDPQRNTSEVLQSSYSKLPNHRKSCLLHLGNFPEQHEISASRLFRMWIAEGFVPSTSVKSMEDRASDYLNELVEESFVAVTQRGSNLRVKTCLLHDLIRYFCLRKADEEGFLSIIDWNVASSSGASSSILKRMSILVDVANSNSNSLLSVSNIPFGFRQQLKSLIIFPMYEQMEDNSDQQWLEYACGEWPRLRVLDLEGLSFEDLFSTVAFLLETCPGSVFIATYHNRSGHHLIEFFYGKMGIEGYKAG